jgi:Fe-S oxidoreductase
MDPLFVAGLISKNMERFSKPLNTPELDWGEYKTEGEWLYFTGKLYQLTPFIELLTEKRFKFLRSKVVMERLSGMYLGFLKPLLRKSLNESRKILRDIYTLLHNRVYYSPDLDFYSGVILYEFGDEEGFEKHAGLVAERLEKANVEKIVTIDPHTTFALKVLYPKYGGGRFKVKSYLELLAENKVELDEAHIKKARSSSFYIHDPCYYGRYLDISRLLRRVLKKVGVSYIDVRNSKDLTSCCGGPIESIAPSLSREIARIRVSEFNGKILTMCPICMSNLRKAGGEVTDISTVLRRCLNG